MLTIVPTPIGNLDDITYRAVKILQSCDLILAEDTRTSGRLLKHLEVETSMRPFHAHNEHKVVNSYIDMIAAGQHIALISDAGTPGISDPGFLLIRAAVEAGLEVSCLPGANAFIPALVASGLPCDKFYFEGFLPHKKGRMTRHKHLATLPCTFILYESPHRLVKCLKELNEHCGPDRKVCVAREISKLHEEVTTDTAAQLLADYSSRPSVKGEIVVVVEGSTK